jgi:RNA polymerase sigma factor (TIGR02999 family)
MPRRKRENKDQAPHPDREKLDAIFEESYDAIKRVIRSAMRGESHPTLETTDLMHDLYLNLLHNHALSYEDTRRVLNLLSEKARFYLIDRARRRKASKRGGGMLVSLSLAKDIGYQEPIDILLLNQALDGLERESPLASEIVRLKWFVGLTEKEIAPLVGRQRATIQRYWEFSKLWIINALSQTQDSRTEVTPRA